MPPLMSDWPSWAQFLVALWAVVMTFLAAIAVWELYEQRKSIASLRGEVHKWTMDLVRQELGMPKENEYGRADTRELAEAFKRAHAEGGGRLVEYRRPVVQRLIPTPFGYALVPDGEDGGDTPQAGIPSVGTEGVRAEQAPAESGPERLNGSSSDGGGIRRVAATARPEDTRAQDAFPGFFPAASESVPEEGRRFRLSDLWPAPAIRRTQWYQHALDNYHAERNGNTRPEPGRHRDRAEGDADTGGNGKGDGSGPGGSPSSAD